MPRDNGTFALVDAEAAWTGLGVPECAQCVRIRAPLHIGRLATEVFRVAHDIGNRKVKRGRALRMQRHVRRRQRHERKHSRTHDAGAGVRR